MKKKILIGVIVGAVLAAAIINGAVLLLGEKLDENKNREKGKLEFALNEDGESYSVVGLGTYSDTDVVIPYRYKGKPVTKIAYRAFNEHGCEKITSITIPDSVESIDECAFLGCRSLTSIEIPDSVTSIGEGSFYGCTSLTSIEIPDSVTSIGVDAFRGCTSLTSIEIPDSVTSIGYYAFSGCTSLTSIEIPDSVTSISDYAFYGCTSLTSIEIPDSVTSIGDLAFEGCTSLTSIDVDENNEHYKSINGDLYSKDGKTLIHYSIGKEDTAFSIPDTVTGIGDYAFYGCTSLTSIEIPDSVTSIGWGAFSGCSALTSIDVDENNKHYKSINGDLYSKDGKTLLQYAIGKKETAFSIPDSVTSIGYFAFEGCISLTSIEIPDSVESIGDYAFEDCSSLTIYCEAESEPRGWYDNWNSSNCPVVWGYKDE